jgi:hypothetical protein
MYYCRVDAVRNRPPVRSYGTLEARAVDEPRRWRTSDVVAICICSLFGLAVVFLIADLQVLGPAREGGNKDWGDLRNQTYAVGFDLTAGYG